MDQSSTPAEVGSNGWLGLVERLRSARDGLVELHATLYDGANGSSLYGDAASEIERLAADRDELVRVLGALIDRYAFDGVPNDSMPVWHEARGVRARLIADEPNVADKRQP